MTKDEIREAGMTVRRKVLGAQHVDRAVKNINEFNADFQDYISRYVWGEVWTRPGIDLKTRSYMTLSMLIAVNRPEEFKMHVRAAFNNGLTREDIKEIILHSAIYCGVPAAGSSMQAAQEVFKKMEEEEAAA